MYKGNKAVLTKLYDFFHHQKKFMSFDDTQQMCDYNPHTSTGLGLSLKDLTFLYAMSKQVVIREMEVGLTYYRTKYLEMIEFIARVSEFKFQNTSMQSSVPLSKKIEYVMD